MNATSVRALTLGFVAALPLACSPATMTADVAAADARDTSDAPRTDAVIGDTPVPADVTDGAIADAGRSDAGRTFSTDTSTYFGAPRCGAAGVQLCDDFEATAVDSPPDPSVWTVGTWGMGSIAIDTAHAARGTHAVHIHTPSVPASVTFRETRTFPATGNTFYGRMFLFIDHLPRPYMWSDTTNYPLVHWTAASASGAFESGGMTYHPDVRAIGAINQQLLINVDGGPMHEQGIGDMAPASQPALVEQQWMCFEFMYGGTGIDSEIRVWWDGVEHTALHLSSTNLGDTGMAWPIPVFASMSFGWSLYQDYTAIMPSGFDVWIDEVAIDTQRIGCSL